MSESLDPHDNLIYRFTPTQEEHGNPSAYWDVAEEYAVEADPEAKCGIVVHARRNGLWRIDAGHSRPIIARLLADLAKLTEERDIYRQGLEQFRDRTNWRLIDSYTAWVGSNGYDDAAEILARGAILTTKKEES